MQALSRHIVFCVAIAFVLILAGCGDVGDAPKAQSAAGTIVANVSGEGLAIDTSRSAIDWRAAKVTRAHEGGFRSFTGTISTSGDAVTGMRVVIDTRSIWSDTDRLTNHLKSSDFFDVEAYPTAEFVADQIVAIDSSNATHLVTGNLTMHDRTNSITFPAMVSVNDGTVRASADFIIDRRDWGITYTGKVDDLVRNDVRLILEAVAPSESDAPIGEAVQ